MARRSGSLRGVMGSGNTLLENLVVRITMDLSGLRRGVAEAVSEIRTLKGAIVAQAGGAGLQDAMTAALVAPVALATARLGQMRNEVRALTQEMRTVAAIGYGGAAARGSGAGGALIIPTGGGPIIDASRATGADGRPVARRGAGGRMVRAYDAGGSDDLLGAATGAALGAGAGADGGRRRRGGFFGGARDWFGRQGARTAGAFGDAADNFPGMADAADNLGMGANRLGATARGAAGSRIAQALGLAGLGSVLGSLISVATSLATVIGGVLAGAFAALATPLGAVIALVTALVALFVAANWDSFREFGEWFAERWRDIIGGEGMGDIIAGWNNLKEAFSELWAVVSEAFKDDSGSITAVLQFFGEVVIRVFNAVLEILGTFLNVLAETVRAITALLRGDLVGAFEHMGEAVGHVFQGLLDTLGSLFPEIQSQIDGFATWVTERFQGMTEAIGEFFGALNSGGGGQPAVNRYRGGGKSNGASGGKSSSGGGGKSSMGGGGAGGSGLVGWEPTAELERGVSAAQEFRYTIGQALGEMATSGARAGDVFRGLLSDLIQMTAQSQLLDPLWASLGNLFGMGSGAGGGGGKTANDNGTSAGGFWNGVWQALGGINPGGGIGGGFGGFFAKGGFLKPGEWGIVGEAGTEIVKAGRSGATITPVNDNNMRVDARTYIDATGADAAAIARLQAALSRRDAELPSRIRAEVGNMGARGRLRYS